MRLSDVARKYIGQTEKTGNSGFINSDFEKKMQAVGFILKQAWCAYFGELCCKECFPSLFTLFDTVFSGSVLATQNNIKKAVKDGNPHFEILEDAHGHPKPEVDCLMFYTSYIDDKPSPAWTGHFSICSSTSDHDDDLYSDISGNTNVAGSREGTTVLDKPHRVSTVTTIKTGLRLTLCVRIKEAA